MFKYFGRGLEETSIAFNVDQSFLLSDEPGENSLNLLTGVRGTGITWGVTGGSARDKSN